MEREFILGKMAGNMKENTKMIKNMAMVFILGLMAENMKANGRMANNMEKENTYFWMVPSKWEYGKMENVHSG